MDNVWKAIETIGTLLFDAGTFLVGLAAFLKAIEPKERRKPRRPRGKG